MLIYLHLFTELFHEDFSSIVRRNKDDGTQQSTCHVHLGGDGGWV